VNLLRLPLFAARFIADMVTANLHVAAAVISPKLDVRPGIVAVPTQLSGPRLVLLANYVTLTPGTISVDVSRDSSVLYVHALDLSAPDELRAEVAEVERRILEVFGP
jgi:multicomponent Na+:H+ antiporter subunit E